MDSEDAFFNSQAVDASPRSLSRKVYFEQGLCKVATFSNKNAVRYRAAAFARSNAGYGIRRTSSAETGPPETECALHFHFSFSVSGTTKEEIGNGKEGSFFLFSSRPAPPPSLVAGSFSALDHTRAVRTEAQKSHAYALRLVTTCDYFYVFLFSVSA